MIGAYATAATIPTVDLSRARDFYGTTLALDQQVDDRPGMLMFRVGDSILGVYETPARGGEATAAVIAVDDLVGAMNELRGKGVTFEEYDLPGLKTENGIASFGYVQTAWFKDPDGNILALTQGDFPR